MISIFRPRTLVLFLGDIAIFALALYLSLGARALQAPTRELLLSHLYPFLLLFVAWVAVYFIAGLYESRAIILARRALSVTLLIAQTINMVIAALFFFFVPLFGIAPKTLLVIYLAISFLLVLAWRAFIFPRLGIQKTEAAILVGDSRELRELEVAMNNAARPPVRIAQVIPPGTPDLSKMIMMAMELHQARVVIADFDDIRVSSAFPQMYNLLTVGVRFVDALTLYENLFGRIPLSRLDTAWLARNVSRYARSSYDILKRAMDIAVSVPAFAVSLVFYPFVIIALKIQDGGAIFIEHPRTGEGGRIVTMYKFRTMTGDDRGNYGAAGVTQLKVTPVGRFLRVSRIDELPQLWNVIKGDLSLIGPRPELPPLVEQYEHEIPYYGIRHVIKPGLSGWAQLYGQHAHHGVGVEETRDKLSNDLYYLKHRSLLLDAVIILKTIKKLLTRSGV